ncbi:hypothetical protein [Archangium sp.]|jgi:hypothetical protein|uniref:hypothetical protein n=1 Tax=Archangium sp. TaxID=1872627 RepID=UPI002ED8A705
METNVELPRANDTRALVPSSVQRAARRVIHRGGAEAGFPSQPLFRVLPLARLIPQDLHSLGDYLGAIGVGTMAASSGTSRGRFAGLMLALSGVGVSLFTDYRLSLKKWVPIEVHEAIDYVWSFTTIASPWLFGYAKKAPAVALGQVLAGVGYIVFSALTDYRGQVGVRWGKNKSLTTGPVGA